MSSLNRSARRRKLEAMTNGNGNELPLPQSIDSEKGVLGSILLAPKRVLDECCERQIGASHFHHPAHATIFNTLLQMREKSVPIDRKRHADRLIDIVLILGA